VEVIRQAGGIIEAEVLAVELEAVGGNRRTALPAHPRPDRLDEPPDPVVMLLIHGDAHSAGPITTASHGPSRSGSGPVSSSVDASERGPP